MKRVLVADDEEVLRMLISDTLEDLGLHIEEAEDGEEALKKMSTNDYDLLILDYMMPKLTGPEVLDQLSPQIKREVPILMLTAKAQKSEEMEVYEAGATFFMAKPFSPSDLATIVEDIMNG
ncbi:two-component response regulator [Halalkalibacter wakoensis JCM 9140]|uniref:Two-component response regulator n=1 Tax=Halalkalibacter wakoensis JCM 9140 TaxID=1236970 RepID=W4Q198_9BACI|nr:response regulator [Halalkalibacter wakoensis]GAE25468.1 two-component response regulator [Halalkalibacter wakoensis JCM 9140]